MTKQHDKVPRHVSFILDGNRRWAKAKGLDVVKGYPAGTKVFKDITRHLVNQGVEYVSAFIFSTENWKRDKREVDFLMSFFVQMAEKELQELIDEDIRVKFIGRKDRIGKDVQKALAELEKKTASNKAGTVVFCLDYGGQQEIVDATKKILDEGLSAEDINAEMFNQYLYAPEIPPIDIVVRTSGEHRISNYQLWRVAYSEFVFIDKNWPEMTIADADKVLDDYHKRDRRFGGK